MKYRLDHSVDVCALYTFQKCHFWKCGINVTLSMAACLKHISVMAQILPTPVWWLKLVIPNLPLCHSQLVKLGHPETWAVYWFVASLLLYHMWFWFNGHTLHRTYINHDNEGFEHKCMIDFTWFYVNNWTDAHSETGTFASHICPHSVIHWNTVISL